MSLSLVRILFAVNLHLVCGLTHGLALRAHDQVVLLSHRILNAPLNIFLGSICNVVDRRNQNLRILFAASLGPLWLIHLLVAPARSWPAFLRAAGASSTLCGLLLRGIFAHRPQLSWPEISLQG